MKSINIIILHLQEMIGLCESKKGIEELDMAS